MPVTYHAGSGAPSNIVAANVAVTSNTEKSDMDKMRSPLELVMLAAWLNVSVDKLPMLYQAHTCEATMRAWKRVADAATAYLMEGKCHNG